MFNIGFAELILVLVIAYVIVGPEDLPKVARWLGRVVKYVRRLIRELKEEVGWNDLMAETADVRKEIDDTMKEADITAELKEAQKALRDSMREAERETRKQIAAARGEESKEEAPQETEKKAEA